MTIDVGSLVLAETDHLRRHLVLLDSIAVANVYAICGLTYEGGV